MCCRRTTDLAAAATSSNGAPAFAARAAAIAAKPMPSEAVSESTISMGQRLLMESRAIVAVATVPESFAPMWTETMPSASPASLS